jgi:RNA polymerase sigma-70 factor (ECF subfamily)
MDDRLDERQVRRAILGDQEARDEIWRNERRFVAAVLHAHLPRAAPRLEIEDVLQDVAMTFVTRVDQLEHPAALRSWLRTVAINAARGALRRQRTVLRGRDATPIEECTDPTPARAAARDADRQRADDLLDLIHRLAPEYREPLLLRAVHGFSQKQIAATLELPETTIETRLARARRMLRATTNEAVAARIGRPRRHDE